MTPEFGAGFDSIAAAIGECTGMPFAAFSAKPVRGGSIHQAWHLDDGVRHYFVKSGAIPAVSMFAAEARGLQALEAAAVVRTPTFITSGQADDQAFLVLEHLEMKALDDRGGTRLGTALAHLHRISGDSFGWSEDNFIGATPQRNAPHHS